MKKSLIVLMALALVLTFGAYQMAFGHANLIPAIKVGGGWTTVVSYVNTQPPGGTPAAVYVHATYQVKNPMNLTERCVHLDGRRATTLNDLTTTVLSVTGGGLGTVFPAADTVGGVIITPPTMATPSTEGFLVLENYNNAGVGGVDGTLTSEAIIFNLASGFLYSQRALTVTHSAVSPGGIVVIEAPACGTCNYLEGFPTSGGAPSALDNTTGGALSRFMFLPPATATTGAYTIALNRPGTAEPAEAANTVNLVTADYRARIELLSLMDAAQGYALGVYDRLEDFRSITARNELVCLAQLSPAQLVGAGITGFIANGGWMNLSPRCRETEDGGTTFIECDGDGAGTEVGDAAIIYKVEFASGYGFAVTPQHQQWYAK